MSREIRTAAETAAVPTAANEPNTFKDRLVKLIPSEIVTAYITLQGLITAHQQDQRLFLAIAVISLLLLTPFYLKKISGVSKIGQIAFTTVAFIVWVMASGGFKILFPNTAVFDDNFLGSIVLIIYTLGIPVLYKG